MYGPGYGPVYPAKLEDMDLCGQCGQRPKAWADWLCKQCRAEVEAQRQAGAETMPDAFIRAFVRGVRP